MLDFRVDTFLTAAQTLNFTRTAEILNITQPAVSQHIKYMEKEYNVTLFEKSGKKLYLSDEGKILFEALTTVKLDEQKLKFQMKNAVNQRTLKFGVTMTVGEFIMPDILAEYISRHQTQNITMEIANTEKLLNRLKSGTLDFAIVEGYFPQNEYDKLLFSREKYIGICSPDSSFSNDFHGADKLLSQNIITRESGSGTREVLEHALGERNLSLGDFHSVFEIGNLGTIKKLVKRNCGISFMYEAAVKEEIQKKELCHIQIVDFDITHDISFIWRKNSIYAEEFRQIYKQLKLI